MANLCDLAVGALAILVFVAYVGWQRVQCGRRSDDRSES